MTAAAITSACGGGGDAASAAAVSAVPAGAVAVTSPTTSTSTSTTVTTSPAASIGSIATVLATTVASEGQTFTIAGTQTVRYGAGDAWVSRDVSGIASCNNAFFGTDPAVGTVKSCQAVATVSGVAEASPAAATATSTSSLMPLVDTTKLWAAVTGYATARVQAANVADPSQTPAVSDIGAFREYCEFSHMSYDDPIVYPGAAGAHLHTFLGNTGTNRNSTAASMATTGNSTCAGGTANRTGYWVPTVIDTKGGTPQKPIGSLIYYKQGYNGVTATSIKPFPAGLRMIAGSAASSSTQAAIAGFNCYRPDGTVSNSPGMPTDCPSGATLQTTILFPQCWDGVNLDSPDHKSHMAYASNGCPSTHPVPLTLIQFDINYTVGSADGTKNWRLSSDNYDTSLPGGYSMHGDWFNGWDTSILNTWTTRCVNASMDCHAFLIGDGRILF